jgi:hypothetical protein
MKEAIYLVIYLIQPSSAPLVPHEVVAQMPTVAFRRPYVTEIEGYKLGASCHDEDYIKRQK